MLSKLLRMGSGANKVAAASVCALISHASFAAIDSDAVNIPDNDKVLFIMGQDTTTLREYKSEVLDRDPNMPVPGGVTLYTSILPTQLDGNNQAPAGATQYVSGIEGAPADTSNGEVNFFDTLPAYDGANGAKVAVSVGLYLSDEWNDCSNQPLRAIIGGSRAVALSGDSTAGDDVGEYTDQSSLSYQWNWAIRRMIQHFRDDQRSVYLRIGYEFDGPWNCYSQAFYKEAFIRIKDIINEEGASNVATVWQAATYPDNGDAQFFFDPFAHTAKPNHTPRKHYDAWYPVREDGTDDVVDWVGISYFAGPKYLEYQWSCQDPSKPWTVPDGSPVELQDTLMDIARERGKPAMNAESAPQGFNISEKTWSCVAARQDGQAGHTFASGQEMWDAFFPDYFNWINENRDHLRAIAYINTDWQSQGRWTCEANADSCAAGYWGITSVQDDPTVLANFKAVAQEAQFVNGIDDGSTPTPTPTPTPETPTPTPTPTPNVSDDGFFYLVHKPSGNHASSCSENDGAAITAVSGSDETSCSQWERVNNGDFFHIKNRFSGKFVAPQRESAGGNALVQPSSWTGNWTQWSLNDTGDGYAQIVNRYTGTVFFQSGTVGDGVELQPSSWSGDYTRWAMEAATSVASPTPTPVSDPVDFTYVAHKPTGYKLSACSLVAGANVVTAAASDDSECSKWETVQVGEYFFLKNVASGLHLAPESTNNGAPLLVQPNTWTGSWVQWSTEDTGDGFGRLVHRSSGKWVFVSGTLGGEAQLQPTSWSGDYTRFALSMAGGETPVPVTPTPAPETPTPAPVTPTPAPETPSPAPGTPTPTPGDDPTPGTTTVEAESGTLSGIAEIYTDTGASGGSGVSFISEVGAGFTLSNVPAADTIVVRYASQNSGVISLRVNGNDAGNLSFSSTGAWVGAYAEAELRVNIASGSSFEIFYENGDAALNADSVEFIVSGPTPTPTASPIPTATPVPEFATVNVSNSGDLGNFLVAGAGSDKAGFTLYTFDNDQAGPSVCNGGCAANWPPLLVDSADDIVAPAGVDGLGTQPRQDGTLQLALNGEPLYFYTPDTQPGDTLGHLAGQVWRVADVPTPDFADATWESAALPACRDLYSGNIPTYGYHTYIDGNQLHFNAGGLLAGEVWGNKLRAVFFRTSESTGQLEHIGTIEGNRSGSSAVLQVPADYLEGKVTYYVSYERFFTPMSEEGKVGNALEYADSALYALNRPEGCVSGNWGKSDAKEFGGWARRQHPQGVFNDHNVFAKSTSSTQNSATHFMHVPRFVVKVVQDQAGQDLIFNVVFTYEANSPFQSSQEIIFSGIEGKGARAGDGSPLHSYSFRCDQIGPNEANCNAGQVFTYGQNVDWELRVQPVGGAGANLYSQMFYYVPGHGWTKESVDPRALLGGWASIDAHGATVYERAAAFMQHEHTESLEVVRDFVRQHQDLRNPIGTPVHGAQFDTCEACHINDGRSDAVFTLPDGSRRIAPPLIGLGLLEQIIDFPGKVGFGWEGDRATVEEAVRFAFDADFGVPNPDNNLVAEITHYTQKVGVPQRDKSKMFEPDVVAGDALFKGKMQCTGCHQETQQLKNGDVIRPYTDMKAHDMGDGTFRTAPLWGIGRAANVVLVSMEADTGQGFNNAEAPGLAQRTLGSGNQLRLLGNDQDALFMHDGRAKGLDAAIRAHGGAAASSASAYTSASQTERNQLLEFLRSL